MRGDTSLLDYTVNTYKKRLDIVNKMLTENQNYYNKILQNEEHKTTKDVIREHNALTSLASYLVYFDEKLTHKKREQYKFEKASLPLQNENYIERKEIKVERHDYKRFPILRELNESIKDLRDFYNRRKDELTVKEKRILKDWISDIRRNKLDIKTMLARPIFPQSISSSPFDIPDYSDDDYVTTDLLPNSMHNPLNLDLFEIESWKIILSMICCGDQISENVTKLVKLFHKIYGRCEFLKEERQIIAIYEKSKKFFKTGKIINVRDITNIMKIDQKNVRRYIDSLCRKMCAEYEKYFEEKIYYTYLVKGVYKMCTKCGQNKIVQKFNANSSSRDGLQNVCRDCIKEHYKRCSKCGVLKSKETGFYKHPNTKDGLQSVCKDCYSIKK